MKKKINLFLKNNIFIGLIPAKGTSQSIKKKNLRKVKGKSLIDIVIENSKKSKFLTEIYLTSENYGILKNAKKKNVQIINRPKKLSKINSKMIDVIKHAIKFIHTKKKNIFIVLLQPTSPFRTFRHIDNAIEKMIINNKKSLISLKKNKICIFKSLKVEKLQIRPIFSNKFLSNNRQYFPDTYIPNGAIYIFPLNSIKNKTNTLISKTFMPFVMNNKDSIDIDNFEDLINANKK
tara:strand:- start:14855 stop:15556 length:702 start_codon:yes stop_codon:yes gene_type:complete